MATTKPTRTAVPDPLLDRIREHLADEPSTREVTMFGGRSFMINDKMICNARHGGDLLVRVGVERDAELLDRADASRAEMGAGRDMGPGWITVAAASIADDDTLVFWLDVALEHNRQVARAVR